MRRGRPLAHVHWQQCHLELVRVRRTIKSLLVSFTCPNRMQLSVTSKAIDPQYNCSSEHRCTFSLSFTTTTSTQFSTCTLATVSCFLCQLQLTSRQSTKFTGKASWFADRQLSLLTIFGYIFRK